MIMGIWRDLTAIVLLAHLVTLSRGSTGGKGAFEEILARNVSIVVIEDNADGPVDLEKLVNATSLASGNNSTGGSNGTGVVNENELVTELEEALVSAASSGQVILIAPPANRTNATDSLPGPVIVIETPSKKSKSLVKAAISKKSKRRKTAPTLDQEIAQSQRKQRADKKEYVRAEDLETLEDLLAITEYEPQRIDAKRIDDKTPRVTGVAGKLNSTVKPTRRPEDTHYDVPKQRNPSRNYQRTSDDFRPVAFLNDTSSGISLRASSSVLRPVQANQNATASTPVDHKVDGKKPTSKPTTEATTLDQKSTSTRTEISRGPRNSEIVIPLSTKPTVSRKLSYSDVARKGSLVGAPSSIDVASTFVPGLSGSTEARLRNIQNLTNTSNLARNNLRSARVQTPVSLPSTYYPFLQQKPSPSSGKTSGQPTLPTSAVPRASRRSDDYLSSDYAPSTNEQLQPPSNQQLGYLSRYNQPLATGRVPKARLYQPEASKESAEEKRSNEADSYEAKTPGSPKVTPVLDTFASGGPRTFVSRTTSRPAFVDYKKLHVPENRNAKSPSILKVPAFGSYEDDDDTPAAQKSGEPRSLEVTGPQASNEIVRHKNSLLVASTTPAYDSYEDDEPTKPNASLQPKLTTAEQQRPKVTANPYLLPNRQAYQPYNYFGRTLQPVNPTSLVDNPIYQLHGVKVNPGPAATNAIYNPFINYQSPSSTAAPLEKQSTRYLPRGTAIGQRVLPTTAASDSYEDSEESKSPPAVGQRLRNPNYVNRPNAKPLYVYSNNQKLNADYSYNQPIGNQYTLYQTKSPGQLPPLAPYTPDRSASLAAVRGSAPAYAVNARGYENLADDERSYVAAATKQALNRPIALKNPAQRATSLEYGSYEDGEDEDSAAPSANAKLSPSSNPNYGNRARSKELSEEERNAVPYHTHAALAAPSRGRSVKSHRGGSKRVRVEEEPVETVQQANVKEAPYQDEVQAGTAHAEDQATHQTHAKEKKHDEGGGDREHEEGGGVKHDEEHHEHHGEKGDKGYKGYHEYDKGKKGHHDKEGHDKEYDEKKGDEKKHVEKGGYHKEHHHGEKGNKEAEFAEKGEHQKGHSTKGQHVVHKKDEYEKKTEFYDESHEEDGDEKGGEYHHEHEHRSGGHEKKGHHDSAHHQDQYGEKGEHEKGHHFHEKKGHDGKDGKDHHHDHHEKYGKKGGHEEGLKWAHKKGDDGHGGGKKKGS